MNAKSGLNRRISSHFCRIYSNLAENGQKQRKMDYFWSFFEPMEKKLGHLARPDEKKIFPKKVVEMLRKASEIPALQVKISSLVKKVVKIVKNR